MARVADFSSLPGDLRWTDPELAAKLRRQERINEQRERLRNSPDISHKILRLAAAPMSIFTNIAEALVGAPGRIHTGIQKTLSGELDPRSDAGNELAGDMLGFQLAGGAIPAALTRGAGGAGLRAGVGRIPAATRKVEGMLDVPPPAKSNVPVDSSVGDKANPGFYWKGKEPHEMTPQDWHDAGVAYGTDRKLGPENEADWRAGMQSYTLPSGKTITYPGGTEPFTYADTLHMKSQGIPTRELAKANPELRQQIHDRMVASTKPVQAPGEMSPHSLFNKLIMGMESPNNPLTPNQLAFGRTMAKGPEDLENWAGMIPWKHGADTISTKQRQQYSNEIADRMGINAGSQGGLGARGTTDYTRIAELAQMMREKPEFFAFRGDKEGGANPAEHWANFVQRVTSQVPGLSAKTGSFGTVWQDPTTAATSAIDRHMVRRADEAGKLFATDDARIEAERLAANRHFVKTGKAVDTFEQLPQKVKDDAYFGYLNAHPSMVVRTKTGELNPKLPEGVLGADWVKEPKKVQTISEPYKAVQEVNRQEAEKLGQGLFSNQWFVWDDIRNRLEPHENLNPDLEKLPRMSLEQTQRARKTHGEAGYLGAPGKPVQAVANPSAMAVFDLSGVPAAAIQGAAGGAPVPAGFQLPPAQPLPPTALPGADLSMLDPEKMKLMFGGPR